MKDDNAYNFRVIDYGDSVQVRLYSTPVLRGGQVSKLDVYSCMMFQMMSLTSFLNRNVKKEV